MERDLAVLVVWALVLSSLVQSVIHFRTWWILHSQVSKTSVGDAMNKREFTMGVKSFGRTLFDLLLATVVTWGVLYLNPVQREILYLSVTIVSLFAIYYGIRFLMALQYESFGYPNNKRTKRDRAQDTRELDQNVREVSQNERDRLFEIARKLRLVRRKQA